jgi:twitching motility protein PilT
MDERTRDTLFGRMALRVGWVTIEQLNAATEEQGRRQYPPPLGELFVELGFMSDEQVKKLLKRQQDIIAEREAKERQRASVPSDDEVTPPPAQRPVAAPASAAVAGAVARAQEAARRQAEEQARREAEEQARMQQEMQQQLDAQLQDQLQEQLQAQLQEQLAAQQELAASADLDDDDPFAGIAPVEQAPETTQARALDSQLNKKMPIRSEEAPQDDDPLGLLTAAPAPTPAHVSATVAQRSAWLDFVLTHAAQIGASDVHLHAGSPITMRLLGALRPDSVDVLEASALETELRMALSPEEAKALDELGQVDLAYTLPGVARFRGNIYKQQRGLDGAFRVVPPRAPTLAELNIPQQIARVTTYHQGIVLFTGPAGCGKSATMAAVVDLINGERTDHILTIEDPIEIVHTPKRAIVNQRHAGHHTKSYARALRGALREDPDVIVIGEMRDYETISLALKAAETGHLVLATLHTNSAVRTINRIIGAFPPNQQGQARSMLSESLRAVISQRLIVRADGAGRVPAIEVLYVNPAVGNLIRDNRTVQLRSVLQTQTAQGMCLLDASLADLIKRNVITWQDAAPHAEDARKLPGAPAGAAAAGGA